MLDLKLRRRNFQNQVDELKSEWERSKRKKAEDGQSNAFEKQWFLDNGQLITRYLEEVHFISTPENFPAILKRELHTNYGLDKNCAIPFVTLDSIVRSCYKWHDYLANKESFDLLICLEVLSMAKIHASVISTRNIYQKQVAKGVRLKEGVTLPERLTTIVTHHGNIEVYQ